MRLANSYCKTNCGWRKGGERERERERGVGTTINFLPPVKEGGLSDLPLSTCKAHFSDILTTPSIAILFTNITFLYTIFYIKKMLSGYIQRSLRHFHSAFDCGKH